MLLPFCEFCTLKLSHQAKPSHHLRTAPASLPLQSLNWSYT
jgi:hypothetical protein